MEEVVVSHQPLITPQRVLKMSSLRFMDAGCCSATNTLTTQGSISDDYDVDDAYYRNDCANDADDTSLAPSDLTDEDFEQYWPQDDFGGDVSRRQSINMDRLSAIGSIPHPGYEVDKQSYQCTDNTRYSDIQCLSSSIPVVGSPRSHLPPVYENEDYIGSPPRTLQDGEFLCGGWGSAMTRTYQSSCLSSLDVYKIAGDAIHTEVDYCGEHERHLASACRSRSQSPSTSLPCYSGRLDDNVRRKIALRGDDGAVTEDRSQLSIVLQKLGLVHDNAQERGELETTAVASGHRQLRNDGDAWGYFVDSLDE
ncbi:MAG: hypothetical protein ACRDL7_09525 [Gaiellaceae bacterium]